MANPKGKFTSRDTQESEADFQKWLTDSRSENFPNEKFPLRVTYSYPVKKPNGSHSGTGGSGVASPPEHSFLYMDVGAWTGSAKGVWGSEAKYLKRDFGIVCGPYALLCAYEHAAKANPSIKPAPEWTKIKQSPGSSKVLQSLVKLVDALSAALPGKEEGLGEVVVRRFMCVNSVDFFGTGDDASWKMYVILGDTHIPVVDAQTAARGVVAKVDQEAIDDEKMTHIRNQGMAAGGMGGFGFPVTTALPPFTPTPRVRRAGRVDLAPIEHLVTSLVGPKEDGAKGLETIVKAINQLMNMPPALQRAIAFCPAVPALLALLTPVVGATVAKVLVDAWLLCDPIGIKNDSMTQSQAERWYKYYRDGVDGGKPADIFEGAGEHLLAFVKAICKYEEKRAETDLRVRFCQLGDLLDFWVGFTCHFMPSKSNMIPVNPLGAKEDRDHGKSYGNELVSYWTETAMATQQGQYLAAALEALEQRFGTSGACSPVFLWGNHDNYLARSTPNYQGGKKSLAAREGRLWEDGVYMEHGHQWEGSNSDDAGTIPVTHMWAGTDSPFGLFLTQAAFLRPKPIRGFEGKAAGLSARVDGSFGQRMTQIAFAADKFVDVSSGFRTYVMGHTHDACLSRIVVDTGEAASALEEYRKHVMDSPAEVYFENWGGRLQKEEWMANSDTAKVAWREMLGAEKTDWISLEDPEAPPCTTAKGLWFYVGNGKQSGSMDLTSVPPGCYEARAYCSPKDKAVFRKSTIPLHLEGISIEGNADHKSGSEFTVKHGEPNRPIILRWTFYQASPWYPDEIWFSIYRKNEEGFIKGRPWKHFKDVSSSRPMRGRWILDSWFVETMAKTPGDWEIRAFVDQEETKRLGRAKLTIKVK